MSRDTSHTYVYRFESNDQKKELKVIATKEGSTIQDEITEALKVRRPKLFRSPITKDKTKK